MHQLDKKYGYINRNKLCGPVGKFLKYEAKPKYIYSEVL